MGFWDYRNVIDAEGVTLAEVYYDERGRPFGWCEVDAKDVDEATVEAASLSPLRHSEDFDGTDIALVTQINEDGTLEPWEGDDDAGT